MGMRSKLIDAAIRFGERRAVFDVGLSQGRCRSG
jgi:hypothetical protein